MEAATLTADVVARMRDALEEAAAATPDPSERIAQIREIRSDLERLLGVADTYIADAELQQESGALRDAELAMVARENADIRDEMLRRGLATVEQLDAAGYVSHDTLDAWAEAGRLQEGVAGIVKAWGLGLLRGPAFEKKVRRGSGGEFRDKPGVVDLDRKGRGGRKLKIKSLTDKEGDPGHLNAQLLPGGKDRVEDPHAASALPTDGKPAAHAKQPDSRLVDLPVEEPAKPNVEKPIRKLKGKRGGVKGKKFRVYGTPEPVTHDRKGKRTVMTDPEHKGGHPPEMTTAQHAADAAARGDSPEAIRAAGERRLSRMETEARRKAKAEGKSNEEIIAAGEEVNQLRTDPAEIDKAGKAELYAERVKDLEKRAQKAVRKAKREGKLSPDDGTPAAGSGPTGSLRSADAHFNEAGTISQKSLLNWVTEACSQPTTTEEHRGPDGEWDESRMMLHARIIDMALRQRNEDGSLCSTCPYIEPPRDDTGAPIDPTVLFTGGGYSAGKGGLIHPKHGLLKKMNQLPENALVIDPDVIKAAIPEFVDSLETDPEANLRCHDDRTETLTEHGWLGLDEIARRWSAGERFRVAAFDMRSGGMRYEQPDALRLYDYDGELHRFRHQSFDLAVTPDHRMVTQRRDRDDWEIVRARDLTFHADGRSARYVPFVAATEGRRAETFTLPAVWKYPERARPARARHARIEAALAAGTAHAAVAASEGCSASLIEHVAQGRHRERQRPRAEWPERSLPMDGFLGYLGWWLAEGDKTGAVVQAKHSPFLREVREACAASGMEGTESWGERNWSWRPTTGSRQLRAWLADNCGTGAASKRVPSFVFDLSLDQRMIVLRGLVNGDGRCGGEPWDGKRSATFSSLSSQLADDAQRLAITCGLRASKRPRPDGMWAVQMSQPATRRRRLPRPDVERYRGRVYCFTMPSSTMVTRRSGFVAITGNCYEEAWEIAQEVQKQAQERGVNVIVDGISNTSPEEMEARIKGFTKAGYRDIRVVYVTAPTEEAIGRAQNRALNAEKLSDRRWIPEIIMRSVHRDVSATVPDLMERASDIGARIEVWDTNQGKDPETGDFNPPLMLAAVGRNPDDGRAEVFHISDPGEDQATQDKAEKLWVKFKAKATEPISGVDEGGHSVKAPEQGPVALDGEPEVTKSLREVAAQCPDAKDPRECLQPVDDGDELYAAAETEQGRFQELLARLAEAFGGESLDMSGGAEVAPSMEKITGADGKAFAVLGPMKKRETAADKIERKQAKGEDASWDDLRDIVRGTFLAPDMEKMKETVATIRDTAEANGWKVSGLENRLIKDGEHSPGPTAAGYMDVQLILESPDGFQTELQVSTPEMYSKKEAEGGHQLYERQRQLLLEIAQRGGPADPEQTDELNRLAVLMSALYGSALPKSLRLTPAVVGA